MIVGLDPGEKSGSAIFTKKFATVSLRGEKGLVRFSDSSLLSSLSPDTNSLQKIRVKSGSMRIDG
jgi:hypothetical protein